VDDDGLEVIDLAYEDDDDVPRPRKATARVSRRRIAVVAAIAVVIAGIAGFIAHRQSEHETATVTPTTLAPTPSRATVPTTTFVPPAGLTGLASGRFVAIVGGIPVLVDGTAPPRRILDDIPGNALVDTAQQGAALIGYDNTVRVIVGPAFDGTRNPLPAGIGLLPDADGRWWSNLGQLQSTNGLRRTAFPSGTSPVAHLRTGYLLVDDARTALFRWQPGTRMVRIAEGKARVLALAHDLVAWADDVGSVVHVTSLTTGRTIDVGSGGYAITARFAPNSSRLAILVAAHRNSMVLADPTTGQVVARLGCSTVDGELEAFPNVPASLEPAPFSWDTAGQLVLVCAEPTGLFVTTLDPAHGAVLRKAVAPQHLRQLVFVGPSYG
jgi:hypothetical protein